MRKLVYGSLTVVAFDRDVWMQEKNVLRITDTQATDICLHVGSFSTPPIATYRLDDEHSVVIDLSDYIRTRRDVQGIFVVAKDTVRRINVTWSIVGLISPRRVLIPRTQTGMPIEPPSMIYRQAFSNLPVVFEACADKYAVVVVVGVGEAFYQLSNWMPDACFNNNMTSIRLSYLQTPQDEDPTTARISARTLEDCKRYCAVRWVSFTGQVRCHTFEVVKANSNTIDSVELLTIDGSYNVVKGREDRFGLRLDNLTAYDLWYYSDVCHSSKVEVSMDGVEWQQVDVVTKTVSLPDGDAGKFNTLNVELKWRTYDAVSM